MGPVEGSVLNGHKISGGTGKNGNIAGVGSVTVPKGKYERPQILPNVLHQIGDTPMVRLNRIPVSEGVQCEVLAKCELFAPGGSHKDRIALRMIEEAEADGRLKPGSIIVEPTSGNTGIGVAMVAAVKGYKCILVMPEKMSAEKHETMARLGATVIRTPKNVLHTAVAEQIHKDTPNSIILDQYGNGGNPQVHYDETAEEILSQCDGKVDMIVMGVGTGGMVSGIGRKIKEKCKNCVIVGVDPEGSIMAHPASLNESETNFWEVEGIGHDWIPDVLDQSVIDKWVKCDDKETFNMARRLISDEGILVGGSCGSAVVGAIKAIKEVGLKKGQRCVIVMPDSVRNYMSKFLSDQWMNERGFLADSEVTKGYSWWNKSISTLPISSPISINASSTVASALRIMNENKVDQLPVLNSDGYLQGVITLSHLLKNLPTSKITKDDLVAKLIFNQFKRVTVNDSLGKLNYILQAVPFAVVINPVTKTDPSGKQILMEELKGVVTSMDLLKTCIL